MSTDLERRLESDMADLAARTPWTSGSAGSVRQLATRRHRRRVVLRLAVALLAVAGSVATIALRSTDNAAGPFVLLDSPAALPTGVAVGRPTGREVSLEPWADPAADGPMTRTRVSLLVDGTLTFGLRLTAYFAEGSLLRYACLTVDGGGTCSVAVEADDGTSNAHLPALGGSDQLIFWTGLPPQTSFVELSTADGEPLWQAPHERVVAFPVDGWAEIRSVIAYDSTGAEVARADLDSAEQVAVSGSDDAQPPVNRHYYSSTPIPRGPGQPNATWNSLTVGQQDAVVTIATSSMGECVENLATLSDWWACVDTVNADLARSVATVPGSAYTTLLGHAAPVVRAMTTHGEAVDLGSRAGHWIVLSFSASTCGPCVSQLSELRTFADEQALLSDGAETYTIATGPVLDEAREYFDSQGVSWPVLIDEDGGIQAAFDVATIPETWIIDPAGNVVMRVVTAITADQLRNSLDQAEAGR